MQRTDDGLVWPPAVRVDLTAFQGAQGDAVRAAPGMRMVYRVNLDPHDPVYTLDAEFRSPDGSRVLSEQILVDGSLFIRGRLRRPSHPDEGTSDWIEMPPLGFELMMRTMVQKVAQEKAPHIDASEASPLPDFRGLGELLPEERITDWERFLTSSLDADDAVQRLPDDTIGNVPMHRYRAGLARAVDAAPIVVALNKAIAGGCRAFPLPGSPGPGEKYADLPCVVEVWVRAEDGYPYRVAMEFAGVGSGWLITLDNTPMTEPFEITRPI